MKTKNIQFNSQQIKQEHIKLNKNRDKICFQINSNQNDKLKWLLLNFENLDTKTDKER